MLTPALDQHLRFPESVEHLRAFDHDWGRYEDVPFPRMLELGGPRASGDLPADTDWERCVSVLLKPAARLTPASVP